MSAPVLIFAPAVTRMWRRLHDCDRRLVSMEEAHNAAPVGSDAEHEASRASSEIRAEIAEIEDMFRARFAATFPGVSLASLAERLA